MGQKIKTVEDASSWSYIPGQNVYRPSHKEATITAQIPPGLYIFESDMQGPYLRQEEMSSDELLENPDTTQLVLDELIKFWESVDLYSKLNIQHKRGILMYGPPGSGKTAIIRMVIDKVIHKYNGVATFCKDIGRAVNLMSLLINARDPRPLVIAFEDLEELVDYDEHDFLQFLDGIAITKPNTIFLATTNKLEALPKRVYRPSRFDKLIHVDYPCEKMRDTYIRHLFTKFGMPINKDVIKYSAGLSFAAVKELVVSSIIYSKSVQDTVARLRIQQEDPNDEDND